MDQTRSPREELDWEQLNQLFPPAEPVQSSGARSLPHLGILAQEFEDQRQVEVSSRFWATLIKNDFEVRRSQLPRRFFGRPFEEEQLDFDERLFAFALGRGISLDRDWRSRALEAAAREHPLLQKKRRNRGRPKNAHGPGVLGSYLNSTAEKDKGLLENCQIVSRELQRRGFKPTQTNICKVYLFFTEKNFDPESKGGLAHVKDLARKFNDARRRSGVAPLKRGRTRDP